MHVMERAVIIAAGEGRRLRPVTLTTPKPLIRVNGARFIDTIIGALHDNGISEIYVVTGYMAEQYESLPAQYPGVTLLHNPYYETCNNISSAFVARAYLRNAIMTEADLLVQNPAVYRPMCERSCYCAYPGRTPGEWTLTLDERGVVTHCAPDGGEGSRTLLGISCWTAEDGERLAGHIERAFIAEGRRDIYWDELALLTYPASYALGVREIARGDVQEIDTLPELAAADAAYAAYLPVEPACAEN